MLYKEFEKIWGRMCKYYDKDYLLDKDMIEIYFNEMKYINDQYDVFESTVYKKCKFFPKVTEINSIKEELNKNKRKQCDRYKREGM